MAIIKRPISGKGVAPTVPGPSVRPKDAATLIIVRKDGPKPRVLMGKRHQAHAFMPNIFVFPGGRIDLADSRVKPADSLHPDVVSKLMARMRGHASPLRAQALAMAAVRETFEETGLIIGRKSEGPGSSVHPDWNHFLETGMRPCLEPMRYIARAITPPGRPRRFDSRFFVIDAEHVQNLESPIGVKTEELLEINWLTIEETKELDLAWITRQVLKALDRQLHTPDGLKPGNPVIFQYQLRKNWHEDIL
ncbi:MAG: NUDIX hydrolase [Hyphomicrobiales bacterium]